MKTIIFGSILKNDIENVNDIDIAIIVPNGELEHCKRQFDLKLKQLKLEHLYYVDKLLHYHKSPVNRKKTQFFHILFCEENDLNSNHPIITSLKKGVEIKSAA